jgi:regulator of sigma E protease
MSILIFIIILAILILAHEFGHFIVAKKTGIRVDEFGIGFPPKLYGKKIGETEYTINAIPFGGFVKIFGEDPNEGPPTGPDAMRSISQKPRYIQALVIAAGVIFNIILAWVLISWGFIIGLPSSADSIPAGASFVNPHTTITYVLLESPAGKAGLRAGDKIKSLESGIETINDPSVEAVQNFIAAHNQQKITISYLRGPEMKRVSLVPEQGILSDRGAIGISLDMIGDVKLPIHRAFFEGAKLTGQLTYETAAAILGFITSLFVGQGNFNDVLGPVGIVKTGIVGSALQFGFVYLLTLMAVISINLAIINLIPFPALDGGRLLFLLIESVKRSPINPRVATMVNSIGFVLLMILMVFITYHDIMRPAIG